MEQFTSRISKIVNCGFASLFVASVIWFASLAIRHYCTWGINGFTGYTVLSYGFLICCHGFLDNAIHTNTDENFVENLEDF
jgi:hypothetical protein